MDNITMIKLPPRKVIATFMPDDYRYGDVLGYTAKQMVDFGRHVAATREQQITALTDQVERLKKFIPSSRVDCVACPASAYCDTIPHDFRSCSEVKLEWAESKAGGK